MRSTLKIKTRLMLTAAAVACLMAAGAAVALWSVREVQQQLEVILRTDARTATLAAQFSRRLADLGRQAQVTTAAAGQPNFQQELDRWNAAYATAGGDARRLRTWPRPVRRRVLSEPA